MINIKLMSKGNVVQSIDVSDDIYIERDSAELVTIYGDNDPATGLFTYIIVNQKFIDMIKEL